MTTRFSVAVLSALLFGTTAFVAPSARADGPGEDAEQAVLDSITALRAAENVSPLRRDADLDEAALIHAQDMASNGFVGHESPRSGDPAARVRAVGARVSRVGENVARAASPSEAVRGLAESAAHRAQILAPEYTDVGVAVVEGDDGFYVVEVFATRNASNGDSGQSAQAAEEPSLPPPAVTDMPVDGAYAALDQALPIAPDASQQAPYAETDTDIDTGTDYGTYAYPQQEPAAPYAGQVPYGPAQAAPGATRGGGYAPSYAAYGPQYGGVQDPASASPAGAPYVTLQALPAPNVQGYWVFYGARWWYFPIPAGARPGQVLAVSSSVTGNPPGVTGVTGAPTQPRSMPQGAAVAGPQGPAYAAPAPGYAPAPGLRGRFGIRRSPRRW